MPETPERCTCGTLLVENARFCHRCGRAVYELTAAEKAEFEPPVEIPAINIAPPPAAQAPLPIGFGNPIALRVALLMSLGITTLQMVPVLQLLFFVWWMAAGWVGVRLYRRLTGWQLNAAAGARLGFLTGLFTFAGMTAVFALTMASSAGRDALLDQMVKQDPRMSEFVNNPGMLGAGLAMVMVMVFVLVVGICSAGGAIGAKMSEPDRQP